MNGYERVGKAGGAVRPNGAEGAVVGWIELVQAHNLSAQPALPFNQMRRDTQPGQVQRRGNTGHPCSDHEHGKRIGFISRGSVLHLILEQESLFLKNFFYPKVSGPIQKSIPRLLP